LGPCANPSGAAHKGGDRIMQAAMICIMHAVCRAVCANARRVHARMPRARTHARTHARSVHARTQCARAHRRRTPCGCAEVETCAPRRRRWMDARTHAVCTQAHGCVRARTMHATGTHARRVHGRRVNGRRVHARAHAVCTHARRRIPRERTHGGALRVRARMHAMCTHARTHARGVHARTHAHARTPCTNARHVHARTPCADTFSMADSTARDSGFTRGAD
jgi:hypothetical protein